MIVCAAALGSALMPSRAEGMGGTVSMGGMGCSTPATSGASRPNLIEVARADGSGLGVAAAVAPLPPKVMTLAVTSSATVVKNTYVNDCPHIGSTCDSPLPPPPYTSEARTYDFALALDTQIGIFRWLGLAANVPFRVGTQRIRHTDSQGQPYEPPTPDIHARDRTLAGLGDPSLMAIAGRAIGRYGFSIRAGALLPFGKTLDEDPFQAGREGRSHEHVQFGTGTLRPVLGSTIGYQAGMVGLDAWFSAVLSLSESSIGYRPGHRLSSGLRASSGLGTTSWSFGLGSELSHESSETWHGAQQYAGSLGRTDLVAVATVLFAPFRSWGFFASGRVPVLTRSVGMQLSYPGVLQLGLATVFDFRA